MSAILGRRSALGVLGAVILLGTEVGAGPPTEAEVMVGRSLFRRLWVPAPTRTDAADGLGPLFNARSCIACHAQCGPSVVRKERDGSVIVNGAVFRVAGREGEPHPWYGRQIQTQSVPGLAAEGRAKLMVSQEPNGTRSDVELAGPSVEVGFQIAPRVAPSLLGRGRLERVSQSAVVERASDAHQRRLGLSGFARMVVDVEGRERLGRFGWKASQSSLTEQTAEAFATDLGLSSPLRPTPYGDCTPAQTACRSMPNGESAAFDGREISLAMIDMVAAYLSSLDAADAPTNKAAERTFVAIGCASCHVPRMPTEDGETVEVFTDLLLHDMGRDLDDGVPEPGVRSSQWRTSPLLDLATRNGTRRYLHDGRAATIAEAVRWHGGEATSSRQAFEQLAEADRQALLDYLERH